MTDRGNAIERIIDEASGCLLPIDEATSLPPASFVDPEWSELEYSRLFHAGWIAVGRSSAVAEPTDYITAIIANEPCVVVRGWDGALAALSNVCPHRSTTIMGSESGSAPSLQCSYHRWTFALDGQLRAAPGMEQASGFDMSKVCLRNFAVDEWHGFVLVNIDGEAKPLRESAPTLDALFTEHRIGECVKVGRLEYDSPWNWKITVENFLESYHHRSIHPQTLEATHPGAKSFGVYHGVEPWSGVDHVRVDDLALPFIALAAYPSLLLSVDRGHGMVWFRTEPLTPTRSRLTIDSYVLPELADVPGIGAKMNDRLAEINGEDIAINERTAAGLKSTFATVGRVSHLEASPWHFRQWLINQMSG